MRITKTIYIAKKLSSGLDDEGNTITVYDTPKQYEFNVQPASSFSDIQIYGERSTAMQKAVIPVSYLNQFKEFDVAYLDGAIPTGEALNGDKANYVLMPPRNGNKVIIIYFQKK
jgi:hypothetical protein